MIKINFCDWWCLSLKVAAIDGSLVKGRSTNLEKKKVNDFWKKDF